MSRFPWLSGVVDWGESVVEPLIGNSQLVNPEAGIGDQLYGLGEAGLQMGAEITNMAGTGLAGLGVFGTELARGNGLDQALIEANQTIQDRLADPLFVFEAETPEGKRYLEAAAALEAPLEAAGQWAGDKTMEATGSPLLATAAMLGPEAAAEILFTKGAGRAVQTGADVAGKAGNVVLENMGQGPTPITGQEGAIKIFDEDKSSIEDRYGLTRDEAQPMGAPMLPVEPGVRTGGELIAEQHTIDGGIEEIREPDVGLFTRNVDTAINESPRTEMTGRQWGDWLSRRGISPEEMQYRGIMPVLQENLDTPLSRGVLLEKSAKDNYVIRRAGGGVADRDNESYILQERKIAEDASSKARTEFRAAVTDTVVALPDALEDSTMSVFKNNLMEATAAAGRGQADRAWRAFDKMFATMYDSGVPVEMLKDLKKQFEGVIAAGTRVDNIVTRQREFNAREGGSFPLSYNSEYKWPGTLGDYIRLTDMDAAPFGGRAQDDAHYRAPVGQFNLMHDRLSRRPVSNSTFRGDDGALYDETTTHLDENQSDLHQKSGGVYGRDLTPMEQAEFDRYEAERERHWAREQELTKLIEESRDRYRGGLLTEDEYTAIKAPLQDEMWEVRSKKEQAGMRAAEIERPTRVQTPDAPWKDKSQRRVKSIIMSIQEAIQRGDEYVTIANSRQQGAAYDSLEYVDDVVYVDGAFIRAENIGESWPEEISEQALIDHLGTERVNEMIANAPMEKDDFYQAERQSVVDSRAESIFYDMEERDGYLDEYGEFFEDYDDAMGDSDPDDFEPQEATRVWYNGEYWDGDPHTLSDQFAEDEIDYDGPGLEQEVDDWYGEDAYSEYVRNSGSYEHIGDEIITNSDVAGTARWYTNEFNEQTIRQAYRELGLEPPERIPYIELPANEYGDLNDSTDMFTAIPITPEIKAAMDNLPLYNRYTAPSGWWDRKNRRDERRSLVDRYWEDEVELYSSYPRGTKKDQDPRPPILTVDEINDSPMPAGDILWPDEKELR